MTDDEIDDLAYSFLKESYLAGLWKAEIDDYLIFYHEEAKKRMESVPRREWYEAEDRVYLRVQERLAELAASY